MTRPVSLSDDDKREIARRYAGGATMVQLARDFRCRFYRIKAILADAEIGTRKPLTANTPIELRLHDALMAAGIGFTTQVRLVGRYVVDISIHQAPVIIEADGARHRAGSAAQERDAKRDADHKAAGYRVFRFTGSEINTDAAKCIHAVIGACGLVPDKEPVYNIRTKFSGKDHPRWTGSNSVESACEYCGGTFTGRAGRRFCSTAHYRAWAVETGVLKGIPKSAEHRANIGEANRRRVQTPETRAKISAARTGRASPNKGKSPSAETRAKISATLMGHQQSDETRDRKRAARLGKQQSPETRAKIAAALSGKPKSAEHRAKLSAAAKARS